MKGEIAAGSVLVIVIATILCQIHAPSKSMAVDNVIVSGHVWCKTVGNGCAATGSVNFSETYFANCDEDGYWEMAIPPGTYSTDGYCGGCGGYGPHLVTVYSNGTCSPVDCDSIDFLVLHIQACPEQK